jgi:hypothetical protein
MKAYWRDDLQESGDYPACNEKLTHDEWTYLEFEVMMTRCDDGATDEGFNMIIKHPYTKRLLRVCSIDFDFKW